MTINKRIIRELENSYRRHFSEGFKKYLLAKYSEEPFPYEFSQQNLYANIEKDIRAYDAGELNIAVKSRNEQWREERKYLQSLYIGKFREVNKLEKYICART